MSKYAEIKNFDIANAPGLSVTVFLSGCDAEPKCKGCFNSIAWDKNYGIEITEDFYDVIKNMLFNEHIKNLVLLGGDPLAEWNLEVTNNLIAIAKKFNKKIWLFTWRLFENIQKDSIRNKTLSNVDVIVDGRFIEGEKDLTLKWKGSSNQRVIDVQKSLKQGKVILYER